jgi:Flp pilus assembly pilin Flp
MLKHLSISLYVKAGRWLQHLRNQRGAQAIEYIGVAALVVVMILALIKMFGSEGDGIAKKIVDKLKGFIDKISI